MSHVFTPTLAEIAERTLVTKIRFLGAEISDLKLATSEQLSLYQQRRKRSAALVERRKLAIAAERRKHEERQLEEIICIQNGPRQV